MTWVTSNHPHSLSSYPQTIFPYSKNCANRERGQGNCRWGDGILDAWKHLKARRWGIAEECQYSHGINIEYTGEYLFPTLPRRSARGARGSRATASRYVLCLDETLLQASHLACSTIVVITLSLHPPLVHKKTGKLQIER